MINTPIQTGTDFNNEDQLYQLAQMRGGAVAESANELSNQNTGILSTIGNGFKNAFKDFVDIISIPSEIIAGTISQNHTIGQAIDQHLAIDQAVFGDSNIFGNEDGTQTTMQKIGGFIVRAPVDILLDPTTYLTFGAGSLSKVKVLSEFGKTAGEQVAKEISTQGLKGSEAVAYQAKRIAQLSEEAGQPLVRDATLNKQGQQLIDDFANHVSQGTENSFYKNEAIKLVNKSADEFGKPTLGIADAIAQVKNSVKAGEYNTALLKQTIDAPLDIKRAQEAIGNLITRKPSLYETFVDKGGIKFLGRSLLSGQRVESAIKMIPMMHQVETLTTGLRQSVFGLSNESREYSTIERKLADKAKNMKNDAIKNIANIFTSNNLTSVEADLVTAAIEHGKMPIDSRLRDVYLTSLGIDTGNAVINGENVAAAVRQVQKANKMNYNQAIANGIPLTKRENYMMHLADMKDLKPTFSNISPTVTLKNAKFAEVQKFVNARTGETIIGKAQKFNLEKYDPKLASTVLSETLSKVEERYGIKIEDIQNQSIELQDKITDFFVNKSTQDFTEMISKAIPGSKADDITSAARVFKENLPNLDFKALKEARVKSIDNFTTTLANPLKVSSQKIKDALQKVIDNNARIVSDVPQFGEDVSSAMARSLANVDIKKIEEGLMTVTDEGVVSQEAKDLLKQLKSANKTLSDDLIKNSIDPEVMAQYMDKLVTEFDSNKVGVSHMFDALLGKDNKMKNLMLELSDKRLELLKKQDDLGELALMDGKLYRSREGEIFRASRPTIQEANASGFHFETSALPIMVHSSVNTIKATVSKEFINNVASSFGKLESEAPEGWREVSVSGLKDSPVNLSNWLTGKDGEKILFHPEIAKRIENFNKSVINDEDISAILDKFDKVTGLFKASVTSIFPAFHGRNAISNVLNSFLDIGYAAVNPARHVMSSQIAKSSYTVNGLMKQVLTGDANAQAALMKELSRDAFTDKRGYTWTMGQIQQLLKDNNIALGNQFGDHIDEYRHTVSEATDLIKESLWGDEGLTTSQKVLKSAKSPLKTTSKGVGKVFDVGQKVGQAIEDHSRMIHFLEHLDRTGDVDLAAQRTKMFLFDYGDLSNFERSFMKRIIPFYTWMKKNVELQVKTLTKTPGRLTTQVHAYNTLSSVMTNGNGLTDEEFAQLPEYMKDQFYVTTARDGSKLHVLTNLGSPLEAAFAAVKPSSLMSSVNPLINLPAELITGYDVFKGGMMSDTNNASVLKNAPQAVKDLVGYVSYSYKDKQGNSHEVQSALNPKMFFFLMNQPFGSRIFKEVLHANDTSISDTSFTTEENLRRITGIRSMDLDIESLSAQAQKKRVAELQDLLTKAGIIYKMDKPIKSKTTVPVE